MKLIHCRFSANWRSVPSPKTRVTAGKDLTVLSLVNFSLAVIRNPGYHTLNRMHCHSEPRSLSRKRWNILATICLVLLIEVTVAASLFFRHVTGRNWAGTSILIAFVLVFSMHQPLERWIWGDNRNEEESRS